MYVAAVSTAEVWESGAWVRKGSLECRPGLPRQATKVPAGNVSNHRKGSQNLLTAGPSGPGGPSTNIPCGVRHPKLEATGPAPTPLFPPPVHLPRICERCDLQAPALQALPSLPLAPGVRGQPEGDTHVTPSGAHEQPGHQDCPTPTPVLPHRTACPLPPNSKPWSLLHQSEHMLPP